MCVIVIGWFAESGKWRLDHENTRRSQKCPLCKRLQVGVVSYHVTVIWQLLISLDDSMFSHFAQFWSQKTCSKLVLKFGYFGLSMLLLLFSPSSSSSSCPFFSSPFRTRSCTFPLGLTWKVRTLFLRQSTMWYATWTLLMTPLGPPLERRSRYGETHYLSTGEEWRNYSWSCISFLDWWCAC